MTLTQPAGWAGKRHPLWGAASVLLVTVSGIAGAVWAYASGQPGAGVMLTVMSWYFGHVAGLILSGRRTSRRRRPARRGHAGVTFRYSTWAYYWLVSVLALTLLGLAGLTAIIAATATGTRLVTAVVAAGLGAALAWFLVTALRLAPGEVTLTPHGVYHRSLTFTHFVPWDAAFTVDAQWVGGPLIVLKAIPTEGTQLRRYTGRFGTLEGQLLPFLAVRAQWLGADPVLVYRALAFYLAHPDQRTALDTTGALEQINSGALPDPTAEADQRFTDELTDWDDE